MRAAATLLLAAAAAAGEAWTVGSEGVAYRAESPETLTRPIRFVRSGASGVEASFVARSLRGVTEDDWRRTQKIAGTRRDAHVNQPAAAYGSEDERRKWGIAGGPSDWDDVSVQWDGVILVPPGDYDLATTSDDGSRVWLDRDRDGAVGAGEWGANAWGQGQGATLRQVHAAVPPGSWTIRVQAEDGGGPNCCVLHWRRRGESAWSVVPPEAFARTPVLSLSGPITFAAPIEGEGELHLGDGCILATAPALGTVSLGGRVRLAADLAAADLRLIVPRIATLDLSGHLLACAAVLGEGTVEFAGGTLSIASAGRLELRGRGRLECSSDLVLAAIDPDIAVALAGAGSLRAPQRTLLRCALTAPLATVIELEPPAEAGRLAVSLDGPLAGAGLMAWRADRHGRWFQRLAEPALRDGANRLDIDLSATAPLRPVAHAATWNQLTAAESRRAGLLLYADRPLAGSVLVEARWLPPAPTAVPGRLALLSLPPGRAATGERVELRVRPEPFPERPMDPACFDLALVVTAPDGKVTRFAGFADQDFRRHDRGDRERLAADGPPRFAVRFRPSLAGRHRLRLEARWADGSSAAAELPTLDATGPDWDGIARVDARDPRFLSAADRFIWPIGQNLNSTYDVRSRSCLGTKLNPDRGSFTREAQLARLIAAGGTGCETWLSPWNLGLEWTDAWAGYHGHGKPNLGNAWALDRYLELAERHGVRVVLSIFNHGQGRDGSGAEDDFPHHPWRKANGGWLDGPPGLFTDERARLAQSDLFRYLAARWGDSPAILVWKLWAEVNLVHAPVQQVRAWHLAASELFARHDPWRHPVTTHWCGDWRNADSGIAAQPGMAMLTIDAYHGDGSLIADLLVQSTRDAQGGAGLAGYGKPVLVTEYGGSPGATAAPRLEAELRCGGWAALVSGHAGAPMLWWFEWIDQGARYGQFGALRRFIDGEDLRDPLARTIAPQSAGAGGRLWCRAWQRPGRVLGYVLDTAWAAKGADSGVCSGGSLGFAPVAAGPLRLEWWDADLGVVRQASDLDHPGGELRLAVPEFARHCAFKLWRVAPATPAAASR